MTMDKDDLQNFVRYTAKGEMIKALNILEGMIRGMAIDGRINPAEMAELKNWLGLHKELLERLGFTDLLTVLEESLQDRQLSAEEKADILWLCSHYTANNIYQDFIINDIQKLQGLLHGIMADNLIELPEIEQLGKWLADHAYLKGIYPYDELYSMILSVLADKKLDPDEQALLKVYFSEFIDVKKTKNLHEDELNELRSSFQISGVCASHPQLEFKDHLFSFTGISARVNQAEIKSLIEARGGQFKANVVKDTDYLIVGNKVRTAWPFSCYGRKVEQAVSLRKAGSSILIVHENDFWNQVRDLQA